MRKNLIGLLILAVLAGVAYYLSSTYQEDQPGYDSSQENFRVKDTASITKVYIKGSNNHEVTLERVSDGWTVNGDTKARVDAVNTLLEAIHHLDILTPVGEAAKETVIKNLATTATIVKIYGDDPNKPIRDILLGTNNQEHTGNYMMLAGAKDPFLVHIAGKRGFPGPRFFTNPLEWRYRGIFTHPWEKIASLKVEQVTEPEESFEIIAGEGNDFVVKKVSTGEHIHDFDTLMVRNYINNYRKIFFENYEETKALDFIDSVQTTTPEQIYTLTDKSGKVKMVKTYKKPAPPGGTEPDTDTPIEFDLDRLYAWIDNKDFVVIQYFVFDKLNRKLSDFQRSDLLKTTL